MGEPLTVLIADSQRLFAQALGTALASLDSDLTIVQKFPDSGAGAIDALTSDPPDVALVDYWMPDMEAPALTEWVLERVPSAKIIVLAWLFGPREIQRALAAGACGFLPKSVDLADVAAAVREAASDAGVVLARHLADLERRLQARFDESEEILGRLRQLTSRELHVLVTLSKGLSIQQVGRALGISPKTVKNHINKILSKTGVAAHEEALALARHAGLIRM